MSESVIVMCRRQPKISLVPTIQFLIGYKHKGEGLEDFVA